MKDRMFGVELEFDSNGLGGSGIGELLYNNGVSEEWYGTRYEHKNYYGDPYIEYEKIGQDGSEIELRSPILQGEKGFKELEKVVSLLNKVNCHTTSEDGLHVHHNAPEFKEDKDLTVKLLKSWKYNEHLIAMFVDEERASESLSNSEYNDSPCPTFALEDVYELEKSEAEDFPENLHRKGFGYRNNLNINSLKNYGSIEFRMHEGTLHWPQIESWIRFGQSFLNGVKSRKNPIMPADNPVVLMNRLKTNKRAQIQLAGKAGYIV